MIKRIIAFSFGTVSAKLTVAAMFFAFLALLSIVVVVLVNFSRL